MKNIEELQKEVSFYRGEEFVILLPDTDKQEL